MGISWLHIRCLAFLCFIFAACAVAQSASKVNDQAIDARYPVFFPGQGAQYVGMGVKAAEESPRAKKLFEKASKILGYDLLEQCKNGPKQTLDRTDVCQPAIFVASMAALERLREQEGDEILNNATCTLGLSLGEYSALCFADSLKFEDGVRLTQLRGKAMQAAANAVNTGMVSILGLDSPTVEKLCKTVSENENEKIELANYLCTGNYVVSGTQKACESIQKLAKQAGAKMCVKLPVAGAFHTDFMQPAAKSLESALKDVTLHRPRIPVISNVDANTHHDPEEIRQILLKQVCFISP